jgi:hypothetical protein
VPLEEMSMWIFLVLLAGVAVVKSALALRAAIAAVPSSNTDFGLD